MSSTVFITGTDTGVGKTAVTAALLTLLRSSGIDAVPMKPVQTGCVDEDGSLHAPDVEYISKACGFAFSEKEQSLVCPVMLRKPASPHLAAELEDTEISVDIIVEAWKKLRSAHEMVIVEGAGGLLVPINSCCTMLDLARTMEAPVVLVTRPGLGTINHTLLSLKAISDSGLKCLGVVFCETEMTSRGIIEADNEKIIEKLGGVRIIGRLPYSTELDSPNPPLMTDGSKSMIHLPAPGELKEVLA